MCEPATIIGIASAASGAMGAIASHQAASAQAAHQNAVAQQQHQQQLRIAERNDKVKKDQHAAELKAQADAVTNYNRQVQLNQAETTRAMTVANQQKKERNTKIAFEAEAAVADAIQAQGQVLSTGKTGQSFLLQSQQSLRDLGMQQAQLTQSLMDSNTTFGLEQSGILMAQYGNNAKAFSNVPGAVQAKQAEFMPYKPIKVKGPSGLSLAAGLVGAAASGYGAYHTADLAATNSKLLSNLQPK